MIRIAKTLVLVLLGFGCGDGEIIGPGSDDAAVTVFDGGGADARAADARDSDSGPADACTPGVCAADNCATMSDGCGGQLTCGPCTGAGQECGADGVANVCGRPGDILVVDPSCFFTVVTVDDERSFQVGVAGTSYAWISIEYEVIHGGWREDLYDREVLNHGLVGLSRNVPDFVGGYILGNAAQIHPQVANLDRKSVFYGRVDLEEKPPGQGYTGYTSWRDAMAWVAGETYRVRIVLDAVAAEQRLEIFHDAADPEVTHVGPIGYFEPALTSAGFTLTFGGIESAEREVKPLGWEFCNLLVEGETLESE
jgi:hypothetical protein